MTSADQTPVSGADATPVEDASLPADEGWFEHEDSFDDDSTWDELVYQAKRRLRLTMPVELPEDLLAAFAASPEAQALGSPPIDAPRIVLRLATQEYDLTLATLRWFDLREVVFDSVPYAQAIAPWDARRFVDELLAFTHFLMRMGTHPHAEEWPRVFDEYASEDLADMVAEPDRPHTPRASIERGRAAGFEVDTPEGLAAWKNHVRYGPPPKKPSPAELRRARRAVALPKPPPRLPGLFAEPAPPPRGDAHEHRATARQRKKKRKAAERARRRNR
jgi:hypothetical protein